MIKHSLFLIAAASSLAAQTPTVHLIRAPEAASKQVLTNVTAVRQLPGGRVLVNDIGRRQLLSFDAALTTVTVVADSASGGANAYGPGPGGLIAYAGDSSLFVDPRDLSMFVIDPTGAIARVAAVPRSQDASTIGSNTFGSPAFDPKGRLVYRGGMSRIMPKVDAKGNFSMPELPDSSAIVRVDLVSRKLDTAGFIKIAQTKMTVNRTERGISMTSEINPMQIVDDWAVLSNGTIALIRGRDYHIDLIDADNKTTSAAKVPFDWARLSDEEKVAVIDSAKTAMDRARTSPSANNGMYVGAGSGGAQRMQIMTMDVGGGGSPTQGKADGAAAGLPPLDFVSPSELPDYRPVFTAGAARPDLDGNLWIRTSATRAGVSAGPIYDVVNSKGELVDRVQVSAGRQIVGFGTGGVVYLVARDDKGAWLEKTHR